MSATSEGLGGGSRLGGGRFVVEVIKVEVRFRVVAIVVVGVFVYVCVSTMTDEKVAQRKSSRFYTLPNGLTESPREKEGPRRERGEQVC